jgi:hypothetical protein
MSLQRGLDGPDPAGNDPLGRRPGRFELRRTIATRRLAVGTLACPDCDAPTAPPDGPVSPAEPLACGFCGRAGHVRDFLSLAAPSRPTRVEVRVVRRGAPARIPAG